MTTPYYCVPCSEELIETEEGNVLGYYGVLVSREGVPMTGGNTRRSLDCPNCGTRLVPVLVDDRNNYLTGRNEA